MESIFHEKQEGSLCAQHCLNALLQGQYFTAVDLAEIAQQLDESERERMAEAGILSEDYRRFLQQPSSNMDDSGFFSIQVILNALRVWGLDVVPYKSTDAIAIAARQDPRLQRAFICNFKEHWFSIRKLGNQWFNLNSLLTGPELVSDTFLSMLLAQLEQEGYSIFVVVGHLPDCEADQLLRLMPAVQPVKPKLLTDLAREGSGASTSSKTDDQGIDQGDLQRALEESRKMVDKDDVSLQKVLALTGDQSDEESLKRALELSMQSISDSVEQGATGGVTQPGSVSKASSAAAAASVPPSLPQKLGTTSTSASVQDHTTAPSAEELRIKRQEFLDRMTQSTKKDVVNSEEQNEIGEEDQTSGPQITGRAPSEMTEEEMLEAAIKMSMQPT